MKHSSFDAISALDAEVIRCDNIGAGCGDVCDRAELLAISVIAVLV